MYDIIYRSDYSINMDIHKVSTQPLGALAGEIIDCRCRRSHIMSTGQILFGAGVSAGIGSSMEGIVPRGSKVIVLTEKALYEDIARGILKRLERAGFRSEVRCFLSPPKTVEECEQITTNYKEDILSVYVDKHPYNQTVEDVASYEIENSKLDDSEESSGGFPEDARIVLGIGGGSVIDAAKYVASTRGLPCYIVATSPALIGCLTPSVMLVKEGFIEVLKVTPPVAVLCDTDFFDAIESGDTPYNHASASLGEIAGVLTALFDWRVSGLITNEFFCPYLAETATDCIDLILERLSGGRIVLTHDILTQTAECSLRLSAIAQMTGNSRLVCGGETHLTHAYLMLFRRQKRIRRLYGEYIGMASISVLELYAEELKHNVKKGFMPPPDNNIRMDKIAGYFGVPWLRAGDKISPVYHKETLDISVYKLTEFRDELLSQAANSLKKAEQLRRNARRTYNDFGYSLNNHITKPDADKCIALAPDIREKFTLLTQLKNMGLLERFL